MAALFVDPRGPYYGRSDVEPWGVEEDARTYAGPHPVLTHPPCKRWGRYWHGGPSARVRRIKGDDDGCFAAGLAAVRRWGGVLEHPEASHAWRFFELNAPPRFGGWVTADLYGGVTCCVEQGHYGHRARKATWLYACIAEPPELEWGKSEAEIKMDEGFHSAEERRRAVRTGACQRMSKLERALTPPAFADLMVSLARRGQPSEVASLARTRELEARRVEFVQREGLINEIGRRAADNNHEEGADALTPTT